MTHALKAAARLSLVALAGCQCLVPVSEEDPDAGRRDAGVTAGRDAGPECVTATDCGATPSDGGFSWCPGDRARSCLDGRCLTECAGGRTCTTTDGGACLECTAKPALCSQPLCASRTVCQMHLEGPTCPALAAFGTVWLAARQNDCSQVIQLPDGGRTIGRWIQLGFSEGLGTLEGLDGTCTVHTLATGAIRTEWACPGGCNFTAGGCE